MTDLEPTNAGHRAAAYYRGQGNRQAELRLTRRRGIAEHAAGAVGSAKDGAGSATDHFEKEHYPKFPLLPVTPLTQELDIAGRVTSSHRDRNYVVKLQPALEAGAVGGGNAAAALGIAEGTVQETTRRLQYSRPRLGLS